MVSVSALEGASQGITGFASSPWFKWVVIAVIAIVAVFKIYEAVMKQGDSIFGQHFN